MAYLAKGLARWVENLSSVPTIVADSRNSHWQGAEFQEILSPYLGHFSADHHGCRPCVSISWMRDPMQVRWDGKKNFLPIPLEPTVYFPDQISGGEWRGASRSFSLFVDVEFIEQSIQQQAKYLSSYRAENISAQVAHLMNVLHLDVTARHPVGPAFGEQVLVQILQTIFPDRGSSKKHEYQSGSLLQVNRACDFIEANLTKRISLTELAKAVGLSTRHLTRAFQATKGQAPYEYVIHRRLARARELIENSSMSLAEIAERVGFGSHAHMAATFRNFYGVSPSHFSNKAI